MKKLKIAVFGVGLYVTGKGTDGFGNILPSLHQGFENGLVEKVDFYSNKKDSLENLYAKNKKIK